VLAGNNSATGNLIVSNTTLALVGTASLNNSLLAINNQSVLDVTAMNAPLTTGNQLSLAGNLVVTANSNGGTSQLVASSIIYGGTLTINNSGPALAAGNTFTLFSAANYSGAFANISPPSPGPGLAWNSSQLAVNGTLAVGIIPFVSVSPASTNLVYGSSVQLVATPISSSPLSYQWFDNLTNAISWATNSTLTLTNPAVADSGNYTLMVSNTLGQATVTATVIISPAPLLITALDTNKSYGTTLVFAGTEFSASGLTNGDTVTNVTLNSDGANSAAPAGIYPINATNALGTGLANYTISYTPGNLTVLAIPNNAPIISSVKLSEGNLIFSGTNLANAGNQFYTLFSTNLALPLSNWAAIATNSFGSDGSFNLTNPVLPNLPQAYFILQLP
jgi:hypothetical protein